MKRYIELNPLGWIFGIVLIIVWGCLWLVSFEPENETPIETTTIEGPQVPSTIEP